ncbi:MAG TPA: hypothetical protein VHM31_05270 [Polyangia bacterium]|nr:hypothetical protein [Polyangia bacterium]
MFAPQSPAPPLQLVVHDPQWLAVLSGVSHPAALLQSPYPLLQDTIEQVPEAHVAVAFGWLQEMPHPPQFESVLVAVSHPSASVAPLEQFAYPAAQADCGTTQPPEPSHVTAAPGFRCGRAVQSCPQVPQFVGSVLVSTHFDPQRFGVGDTQLDAQVGAPVVVEHRPSGAVQLFVQLPHVAGRVKSVSQPSSGFDEQCP